MSLKDKSIKRLSGISKSHLAIFILIFAIIGGYVLLSSHAASQPGASLATCSPSPCTPGTISAVQHVTADDGAGKTITRSYYIYRPANLTNSPTNKAPLLFVFSGLDPTGADGSMTAGHGCDTNGTYGNCTWRQFADQNRFVGVYFAVYNSSYQLYYNKATAKQPWPTDGSGFDCTGQVYQGPTSLHAACFLQHLYTCGITGILECDDVPAENAVLDAVIPSQNIDTQRIYAEGESKGGLAVANMACDPAISYRIHGFINVSEALPGGGTQGSTHCPAWDTAPENHDFAYITVAGDNDFTGTWSGGIDAKGLYGYGTSQVPQYFYGPLLGCNVNDTTQPTTNWHYQLYTGCGVPNRAAALLWAHGGGHAWSGLELNIDNYDSMQTAWDFIATYGGPGSTTSTPSGPSVGDVNSDGHVDITDLSILLSHFGQQGNPAQGDCNSDGTINITDLSILMSHYGM